MSDHDVHPIIAAIRAAKRAHTPRFLTAYCTVLKPIRFTPANSGRTVPEDRTADIWPAGTVLKITMASRFGDVGLTDDLDAATGYLARVYPDDGTIGDIRWEREPTGG